MEKASFDWPIVLQYAVKAKCWLISRKFSGMKFFSPELSLNQPKATHVCIRLINQSNSSVSVHLLFLFCSRIFIQKLLQLLKVIQTPGQLGTGKSFHQFFISSISDIQHSQKCHCKVIFHCPCQQDKNTHSMLIIFSVTVFCCCFMFIQPM